jgi:class 3 adenylate cyclase
MTDPLPDVTEQMEKLRKSLGTDLWRDVIEKMALPSTSLPWSLGLGNGLVGTSGYSGTTPPLHALYAPRLSEEAAGRLEEHEKEVVRLSKLLKKQAADIQAGAAAAEEQDRLNAELRKTLVAMEEKERVGVLLNSVSQQGQERLLSDSALQEQFLTAKRVNAFVMSVDIRRSTELMLKARSPEEFAEFLSVLTQRLITIITNHYGVFDKFTGDGVLAFFPEFYTGPESADWVLNAAAECHDAFRELYKAHRRIFVSVLKDVGLGIGIDHGTVNLVRVANGLTVVGVPVVYACRLSSAPHGVTLLNQGAYEEIRAAGKGASEIVESELDVKHEGLMVAYEAKHQAPFYDPRRPDWANELPSAT